MNRLSHHPINQRWPARHPERLQLYTLATPNGVKVSIMLEETGLPYEAHRIDISQGEQFEPAFLAVNPNNKIPAIIDPQGPDGQALALFESGAILIYLAEKTGQLLSREACVRYQTLQWLMWQVGGVGPMFGQLGFFHKYAGSSWEDKRPLERYVKESQRLLGVLESRLGEAPWVMGEHYSIADIAILPWVHCLQQHYQAEQLLDLPRYPRVAATLHAWLARPAVQRGLQVAC